MWTQKMLFSSRNERFLVQTWTPAWAPGPVCAQKMLFSSRNELFVSTDLDPWLGSWPCVGLKEGVPKQK